MSTRTFQGTQIYNVARQIRVSQCNNIALLSLFHHKFLYTVLYMFCVYIPHVPVYHIKNLHIFFKHTQSSVLFLLHLLSRQCVLIFFLSLSCRYLYFYFFLSISLSISLLLPLLIYSISITFFRPIKNALAFAWPEQILAVCSRGSQFAYVARMKNLLLSGFTPGLNLIDD